MSKGELNNEWDQQSANELRQKSSSRENWTNLHLLCDLHGLIGFQYFNRNNRLQDKNNENKHEHLKFSKI